MSSHELLMIIISAVIAYMLGSISPSTLIARKHGINIKKAGSGNAGTTNTLRVLGAKAALATLVIDIGKGILAVGIGYLLAGHTGAMVSAPAAFIGHCWPVYYKFRGGKGVAVAFGVLVALNPKIGFALLLICVLSVLVTRRVSFGSIIAAIACPILCWFLMKDFFYIGLVMGLLVLFNHRSNIMRLIRHEEDPVSISWFKKKAGGSSDGGKEK
ncbi:MAG: glycerol-3-phosphate 1-O-acyltransferase PlsY [Eubacterium sp.]